MPLVAQPAEHLTGHGEQDGIVAQAAARQPPNPLHRLSERRERVGSHLEAQHVRARPPGRRRIGSVCGALLATSASNSRTVLPRAVSSQVCSVSATATRVNSRALHQLRAPVSRAFARRGERLERLGDAQLLLCRAGAISEEAPDVFAEACVADVNVCRRAPRAEQPTAEPANRARPIATRPRLFRSATTKWGPTTACQNACVGNACTGECVPGATRCSSETQLQTCNEQGQFLGGSICPFACVNGSCGGECSPGSRRCSPNNGVPQSCSSNGIWQSQAPCPFVCTGSGSCGGECSPGSRRCSPTSGVPQLCSQVGSWQNQAACPFVCSGNGSCGGECVPGSRRCGPTSGVPQLCSQAGSWQNQPPCQNGCNANTGLCNNLIPLGATGCTQSAQCAGSGSSCEEGRCCEFDCSAAGRECSQSGVCECPSGTTLVGNACLLINGQDCDPNRSSQCASGRCDRWFRDGDNDLHGDPNQSKGVCGNAGSPAPEGFVLSSDDCCDGDAAANPDQTTSRSVQNACGSFDYDCDGSITNDGQANIGVTSCAQVPLAQCSDLGSDIIWTPNGTPPACGTTGTFTACSSRVQGNPVTVCTGITGGTRTNSCR